MKREVRPHTRAQRKSQQTLISAHYMASFYKTLKQAKLFDGKTGFYFMPSNVCT
jgi:hypothetical protein